MLHDEPNGMTGLRLLLVMPVERGTGEIITGLQIATRFAAGGGDVRFLASPLARRLVEPSGIGTIEDLGPDGDLNAAAWRRVVRAFEPDVVLFLDYPLMFFPSGCVPLARVPGWTDELAGTDSLLVTTDHFGFLRAGPGRYFGPPHMGFHTYFRAPELPDGMRVLLPCPMHDPGPVPDRTGQPFRYRDVPIELPPDRRAAIRAKWLVRDDEKLIFHFVPGWAVEGVRLLKLPLYDYYPDLLDHYLGDIGAPVHFVSVNGGELLRERPGSNIRITNLGPLVASEFEELLLGADLALTENGLSISLGKAACGRQTCAAFTNSYRLLDLLDRVDSPVREIIANMEFRRAGTVYPWAAYPSVTHDDLDAIGLYRDNAIRSAFVEVELFGGDRTRTVLRDLLRDESKRSALRERQAAYIDAVSQLPDACQAISRWLAADARA